MSIEEKKAEIAEKEKEIDSFDRSEYAEESDYDTWLDEIHEGCSLCSQYGASRILAEVDPIAYRCGFSDYIDGLNNEDFDEYKELIEELEELESELEDLETV